ncbi:hypothetical protein [Tenacibaculum finnmarkense]|uniref:hypothetical protein n=1 Tax=Tenacibaculum finnmarkense TaxID=2781243 RepID=UPI001EFACDFC|nr:hypothetical protein [Tenacibaculum finnmarkense]MCG8754184.1 hypothetical protein [Tenacibaculum finnmarkense]MCG8782629.1 hypothetical protein [Tenacibaculum finnmarkense]
MKKTNSFKLAMVAVGMLTIGTVSAQVTTTTDALLNKNADATKVVKSVDNKGTIKYIQGANGITTVTSTTAGNETVTTFQLGGELISATAITSDAQTGGTNTFAVKGIGQIDVSTVGLTKEENIFSTNADVNTKGFTFVVRDEATGEIKKITAEDIATFLVSIRAEGSPAATTPAAPTNSVDFNVPGLPLITPSTLGKLFVYRNGVKLRINTDFTATVAGKIEITNTDFPLYTTDMIEVQFTR